MEDLFQILIILIFIIGSIISSLNKKKKRQKVKMQKESNNPVVPDKRERVTPNISQENQKSSSDILEEMFGLKIKLPEPQSDEAPIDYSESMTEEEETWDPAKDYEGVNDPIRKVRIEKNYDLKDSEKKTELLADKEKHRAFKKDKKSETLLYSIARQKLFSEEANLKEYIIVQEILNKPKALRK